MKLPDGSGAFLERLIPMDGLLGNFCHLDELNAMEKWMKDLGLVMNLSDLGVKEDMIEGLADATLVLEGGYKVLDRNEIMHIFKQCL